MTKQELIDRIPDDEHIVSYSYLTKEDLDCMRQNLDKKKQKKFDNIREELESKLMKDGITSIIDMEEIAWCLMSQYDWYE